MFPSFSSLNTLLRALLLLSFFSIYAAEQTKSCLFSCIFTGSITEDTFDDPHQNGLTQRGWENAVAPFFSEKLSQVNFVSAKDTEYRGDHAVEVTVSVADTNSVALKQDLAKGSMEYLDDSFLMNIFGPLGLASNVNIVSWTLHCPTEAPTPFPSTAPTTAPLPTFSPTLAPVASPTSAPVYHDPMLIMAQFHQNNCNGDVKRWSCTSLNSCFEVESEVYGMFTFTLNKSNGRYDYTLRTFEDEECTKNNSKIAREHVDMSLNMNACTNIHVPSNGIHVDQIQSKTVSVNVTEVSGQDECEQGSHYIGPQKFYSDPTSQPTSSIPTSTPTASAGKYVIVRTFNTSSSMESDASCIPLDKCTEYRVGEEWKYTIVVNKHDGNYELVTTSYADEFCTPSDDWLSSVTSTNERVLKFQVGKKTKSWNSKVDVVISIFHDQCPAGIGFLNDDILNDDDINNDDLEADDWFRDIASTSMRAQEASASTAHNSYFTRVIIGAIGCLLVVNWVHGRRNQNAYQSVPSSHIEMQNIAVP